MHTSHPNVLELIAVDMNPQNATFSLISEFMVNGNIMGYIRVAETNRIRLVRYFLSLVVVYTNDPEVGRCCERVTLPSQMRNYPWRFERCKFVIVRRLLGGE